MKRSVKKPEEFPILREGGKRLARVMARVAAMVRPGLSTDALDKAMEELIRAGGDTPALLGYRPKGARRPFPATVCISVNDEVVHGIPNENPHTLKEGDLISFDCCLSHRGLITDTALTVGVGSVDESAKRLMRATQEALKAGIEAARGGNTLGDIGAAIGGVAKTYGYGNVYELGGHGVGYAVHEDPYIMNQGVPGEGEKLVPGMVLALEPMFTEGTEHVRLMPDGYTYVTRDGSRAAHFEHTILITEGEAEILTREARSA